MIFEARVMFLAVAVGVAFVGGCRYKEADVKQARLEFSQYQHEQERKLREAQNARLQDFIEAEAKLAAQEQEHEKRIAASRRAYDVLVGRVAADRMRFEALLAAARGEAGAAQSALGDMDAIARGAVCAISQPGVAARAQQCDEITEALRMCRVYVESLPR